MNVLEYILCTIAVFLLGYALGYFWYSILAFMFAAL